MLRLAGHQPSFCALRRPTGGLHWNEDGVARRGEVPAPAVSGIAASAATMQTAKEKPTKYACILPHHWVGVGHGVVRPAPAPRRLTAPRALLGGARLDVKHPSRDAAKGAFRTEAELRGELVLSEPSDDAMRFYQCIVRARAAYVSVEAVKALALGGVPRGGRRLRWVRDAAVALLVSAHAAREPETRVARRRRWSSPRRSRARAPSPRSPPATRRAPRRASRCWCAWASRAPSRVSHYRALGAMVKNARARRPRRAGHRHRRRHRAAAARAALGHRGPAAAPAGPDGARRRGLSRIASVDKTLALQPAASAMASTRF